MICEVRILRISGKRHLLTVCRHQFRNLRHINPCFLIESKTDTLTLLRHFRKIKPVRHRFDFCNVKQIFHGLRRISETVDQFLRHLLRLLLRLNVCDAFVDVQLLQFIWNIPHRDIGVDHNIDRRVKAFLHRDALRFLDRLV